MLMINLKKIKTLYFFLILFVILIVVFFINPQRSRTMIMKIVPSEIRLKFKTVIFGKKYLENKRYYYEINYNEKKLPQIQFEKLETIKLDVNSLIKKPEKNKQGGAGYGSFQTAFIEEYENDIMLITHDGAIKIIRNLNPNNVENFKTNLKENIKVVGSLKDGSTLYLAIYNLLNVDYAKRNKNDIGYKCYTMEVQKSIINKNQKSLNFDTIFETNECSGFYMGGGEFAINKKENKLYLTTSSSSPGYKDLAQDDSSVQGKIIQIDLNTNNYKIYTKGHRNSLGLLLTKDNFLISTENGPYGGDEINKIIEGENYGWPISSYGEYYGFYIKNIDYEYKKNHSSYNYKEPIFAFVPSIGISRIIEIPNDFSKYMNDNFFITSLNRRSIYRSKFDDGYNKLLFREEIRVGGRVRDIAYLKNSKSFVLYLEDVTKLMILKSKN